MRTAKANDIRVGILFYRKYRFFDTTPWFQKRLYEQFMQSANYRRWRVFQECLARKC